jgi:hypothetical protein
VGQTVITRDGRGCIRRRIKVLDVTKDCACNGTHVNETDLRDTPLYFDAMGTVEVA